MILRSGASTGNDKNEITPSEAGISGETVQAPDTYAAGKSETLPGATALKKVKTVVSVFVIAAMLLIWPVGVFRDDLISRTAADYSYNTGPIGMVIALQEFVPKYSRIRTVGVDIGKDRGDDTGIVTYRFYDKDLNEFASYDVEVADMKDGELTDIPVNLKLTPGEHYYIGVDARDYEGMGPVLHFRSKALNGPDEHIHFYIGPEYIENASANIRYTYEIPLKLHQILFYDSFIILVGVALTTVWKKRYMKSGKTE